MIPNNPDAVRAAFAERERGFTEANRVRERHSSRLSLARLITFGVIALLIILVVAGRISASTVAPFVWTLMAVFVVLVAIHSRVRRQAARYQALATVNAEAGLRSRRAWNALPQVPQFTAPAGHPYAEDLGLFGHASLWQLLPRVSAAPARAVLGAWLLEPASPAAVRERQEAVAELTPRLDLRDDLAVLALWMGEVPPVLLANAARIGQTVDWLGHVSWLIPAARALTLIIIAMSVLIAIGTLPFSSLWIPVAVSAVLWIVYGGRVRQTLGRVDTLATALPWYANAMDRLAKEEFSSPLLRRLAGTLEAGEHPAGASLRSLRRTLQFAEVRYSPMLHAPLQLAGLWDFHVISSLANWAGKHGDAVGAWLQSLGEIEALAALAGLGYANPGWRTAELIEPADGEETRIEARAMGHPLIAPEVMVANDITIGPPGTFVLVTGSNMSGKSTLLRAVGLNTVLAQAGAAVCASALRLCSLRVHTSIRVTDSLEDGISLFMAELRRLRSVVDAAEEPPPAPPALYLLDELLQGTNSAERHEAARTVIARLTRSRSIGLVTTHDVALASAPELTPVAVPMFFQESVLASDSAPLSFDYRLRPGVVPMGNAMKLLALVGLAEK